MIVGVPAIPFSCFKARNLVWLAAWHTITSFEPRINYAIYPRSTTTTRERTIYRERKAKARTKMRRQSSVSDLKEILDLATRDELVGATDKSCFRKPNNSQLII